MKMGFLIDHRKCIGCHACSVACKEEHQVALGVYRTWVKYVEKGSFPNTQRNFTVLRCNHCEDAPCRTICPFTALYKADNGIVDFDSEVCIGCKACMQACPYDALYIDPDSHTAAKCNFCAHRLDMGLEPACVVVWNREAIEPEGAAVREQEQAIEAEVDALDRLWQADLAGYAAAYTQTVRAAAAELGITVPVEVVDLVDAGHREPAWDTLPARLHDTARDATPLPTSGRPPRDYPVGSSLPGEIDHAAGRTYLARLRQQQGGVR